MRDMFRQIIADFHERELPDLTKRRASLPWLEGKVDAVIGMRRSGKTWFLYQIMKERLAQGTPQRSMLYVNFEDERLVGMGAADLGLFVDEYFRMYPTLQRRDSAFFLDEIHVVEGWERFVRRVVDTMGTHVVLSGSSAKLLSTEIATSLRGRALATELYPFDLAEAMTHAGMEVPQEPVLGSEARRVVEHFFQRYLIAGGFPEVQGLDFNLRTRILGDYLDVAILRDVIERHDVANVTALRRLVRHLVHAPATKISVNKVYNTFKSMGVRVGKESLYSFLDYLEEAFVFFAVPLATSSERVRQTNPQKYYAVDTGLAALGDPRGRINLGRLLETFVFLMLKRRELPISYLRTSSGKEVDFVTRDVRGRVCLIQV